MAIVGVKRTQPKLTALKEMCTAKVGAKQGEGLRQYYLQLQVRQKMHNFNRLEAQCNELNSRECFKKNCSCFRNLDLYVGEVVKVIDKNKVLVKIRDYRKDWHLKVNQPIAGNYYPINLGMFIKDDKKELSVLVDRAVGGSSIVDGQVEIMLHRRLIHDDDRGVAEALNETVCVLNKCTGLTIVGKYYLRIDPLGEGAKWRRSFGQEIYSPFLLAFTEQDESSWKNSHVVSFSGIDPFYVVPDNVAIIALQELDDGKVLLRLAHLYEVGEDKDLSVIASVELKKLFANKKIKEIKETSLSANQGRAEMEKKRLVWKVEGSPEDDPKVVRGGPVDPATLVVELAPMEIRTFVLDFN